MSSEFIAILVLGLVVVAIGVAVTLLWRRPIPLDRGPEVAELRRRVDGLPNVDIEPLRVGLQNCESKLANQTALDPRVEGLVREVADLREKLEQMEANHRNDEPAPVLLLHERLRRCAQVLSNEVDRAFVDQCLVELEEVESLISSCGLPDWHPEPGVLDRSLSPASAVGLYEVSDESRAELAEIAIAIEARRAEAVDILKSTAGIELIAPVPGEAFDPVVHEDSPATRLTPATPDQAHKVIVRVSLGYRQNGKVVEKAWVKRYAGYDSSVERSSEPPPPEPAPVESSGDNEARSLLQQAAEHGNG